ncbi:MAG TPA: autotransporter-associated beta strand repeat-containing protein, partial [Tepidisphaeraceae bacterium]|nr:autotransporter-associated beta strand repeat-containing protein [Tepidisphaeraceae bacterium]
MLHTSKRDVSVANRSGAFYPRLTRALAVVAAASAPVAARAVQLFWDVNGVADGSGATVPVPAPDPVPVFNWSTLDANWNLSADGAGPAVAWSNLAGNDAVFSAGADASGAYTVTLGEAGLVANALVFKDGGAIIAPGAGASLTLGAGGITNTSAAGTPTITAGLVLSAPQTWTNNGAAGLSLKGTVDNGGHLLTWTGTQSISPDATGVISGNGGLTINGTGTIDKLYFMSAYNTFTGNMTLSGGGTTVIATNGTGTPNAPTSGSFGTGTLILNGGAFRGGGAINNIPLNVFNTVIFAADTTLVSGYNLLFSGDMTLTGGTRTLTSLAPNATGGVLNLAGVVKGNQSFVKAGTGWVTLSGANTFGGAGKSVTLVAGGLNLNHASALGDAANTFVIEGGTINNTSGSAITLANPHPQTWDGDFSFGGASTALNPSELNLGAAPISLGSLPGTTRTITTNGASTSSPGGALIVGGVISNGTDPTTPTTALTKGGLGTLVLTGPASNTYTGLTTVTRGTLRLSKDEGKNAIGVGGLAINGLSSSTLVQLTASHQIPDAAPVAINSAGTVNSKLDLNGFDETIGSLSLATTTTTGAHVTTGAGTLTVTGDLTLNNNRIGTSGSANQVLISGNLNLGGAVRHFTLNGTGDTSNTLVALQAAISNGGIIKDGTATNAKVLVLSGANTYAGGTTINSGTIRSGAADVIPDTGAVNIIAADGFTATLDVVTFNDTTGPITLGGAGPTSTPTITGSNTTSGVLTLTAGLTYDATNNPLGATIAAKLDLGGADRTFTIGDSTTAATDTTISNVISGSGFHITKAGAGTLTIHNSGGTANSFVDTNVNAGRVFFSGTNATNSGRAMGTGVVNVASGTTLGFVNGQAFTPSRTINVADGATIVSRTNTTTLNNANVHLPTAGTLILNDDDVATAAITITGA